MKARPNEQKEQGKKLKNVALREAANIETVQWSDFHSYMDWEQGEHVTLIAPTGQGKTTLAKELLKRRGHVMVLANKKKDKTLTTFKGYKKSKYPYEWQPRTIIYPPFPHDPDELFKAHREVFRRALVTAYRAGSWCVYADEVRYLAKQLNLQRELELLWLQGRSLGVSLVVATQRPKHIPLEAYDAATHLFFWRDSDLSNVQRISEIGGNVDREMIMETIPNLPKYHFLYVNTRQDTVVQSKVDL
jgi:energy-coupling factor transporter ATP-binding protein EcfA2